MLPSKTENDPCLNDWRIPTDVELNSLNNKSSWTINDMGQPDYWFCGSNMYSDSVAKIFLPAAGDRNDVNGISEDRCVDDIGLYNHALVLALITFFVVNNSCLYEMTRSFGYSVRCVPG